MQSKTATEMQKTLCKVEVMHLFLKLPSYVYFCHVYIICFASITLVF